jgi:hypothetical protein
MTTPVIVTAAVEGSIDEAALRKIVRTVGSDLGDVYGRNGKQFILKRIAGYNHSARYRHWVVLVDLDDDYPCAPEALADWLPAPAQLMEMRIAVREVESWLLADRDRISAFLDVAEGIVPGNPDELTDPKLELVNLARRSRSRAIRDDMVPDPRAGQSEGPAYASRIIHFIADTNAGWRPIVAAQFSASLSRCIQGVRELVLKPFPPR